MIIGVAKRPEHRYAVAGGTAMPKVLDAACYSWADLAQDAPMAKLSRRRIIGQHMMISQVRLERGCHVPTHAHANEQFAMIMSGALRFGIGADGSADRHEVVVKAGEVLHLPPHVPHSADALEDTLVLDLFSPPSEKTGIDREGFMSERHVQGAGFPPARQ
jgi:quercetin dioxygenase-like cupin family protein